jgi:hypothetical protein
LNRNLSSADAKAGDNIDFEVLDEVKVSDVVVIPKGNTAIGTITDAEHKKRMARGGKLDIETGRAIRCGLLLWILERPAGAQAGSRLYILTASDGSVSSRLANLHGTVPRLLQAIAGRAIH